jgi:hypothetical protein
MGSVYHLHLITRLDFGLGVLLLIYLETPVFDVVESVAAPRRCTRMTLHGPRVSTSYRLGSPRVQGCVGLAL